MRFKFPVFILTMIAFASLAAISARAQGRVTLTWEVLEYDIRADLPSDLNTGRDIAVTASLSIKNISSSSYSRLTMRISEQAKVSAVTANGSAADFAVSQESTGGARTLQRIVTSLPSVGPGQTVNVTVRYSYNVSENDGLASLSPLGSQFLPFSFWYPTPTSWFFTGGADFAPVKLTVNTNGNGKVFSSGNGSGSSFTSAVRSQPFFVAGAYESAVISGVEVAYPSRGTSGIVTGRLEELAGLAVKANDFVASRFGRKLQAPLRIVFVKRGAGFSDSGTILLDDSVLVREKIDAIAVQTIAEGISKSYLGNMIKIDGDGYGVIREGLSRYLGNEFIESEFGAEVAKVERLQQRTNYSAIARRDAPLNLVSPVDGYYYTATANKGSLIWGYLANRLGEEFFRILSSRAADSGLDLAELRSSFAAEKAYLDYMIDRVTEMNLMIGNPQKVGGQWKSALRNLGEINANVIVTAKTASGKELPVSVTIKAKDFGEAVFATSEEVVRVEVDSEKSYPQVDYSDDIAPRVIEDPDPLLFIKREFDRQRYAEAERNALAVLGIYPEYHDARVLLARSLLAQSKMTDARRQFEQVLAAALPSPQSIAWSELGLGEIAQKTGRSEDARSRFRKAIAADAEYGATLAAVRNLMALSVETPVDDQVKAYFAGFDRAVVSNSKAEVQAIISGGEVSRFAANVAGQAQQWSTSIAFIQEIDAADVIVATNVELKLLNREVESGVAVFRLTKTARGLKLSTVEIFEVG